MELKINKIEFEYNFNVNLRNFMFVDQQNRYTSLDKCLKIDFFKKFFEILAFGKALK